MIKPKEKMNFNYLRKIIQPKCFQILVKKKEETQINCDIKYDIDGYYEDEDLGIVFKDESFGKVDIEYIENNMDVDWVFNVEGLFIRKVKIGNLIVCEIPKCDKKNWCEAIPVVKNNVFLYTGTKDWIWLTDFDVYKIEIEGEVRKMWLGEICSFDEVLENTCLNHIITEEGKQMVIENTKTNDKNKEITTIPIIYARCRPSMYLLDGIHREYIKKHKFKKKQIVGIKSVAGSGKTTTLLTLSKIHKEKNILYIAFNKSLIKEIRNKIRKEKIKNLYPKTFDALLYSLYISVHDKQPEIQDLKPHVIGNVIQWFKSKPFRVKKYYCKYLSKFCNDHTTNNIYDFSKKEFKKVKPMLVKLWNAVVANKLITFETIRKQAFMKHWFKDNLDKKYDMIMVDETQDFDMIMLKMLLTDTTIPKIFVGDPKQSIYQFRGCINAFQYLPEESLIIEFYSTFRIGNPACDIIRKKFRNCWMISKSKNETNFVNGIPSEEKYTYLFRSWKVLLTTASHIPNIWINDFDNKLRQIKKLHNILSFAKFNKDEINSFEDDLPKFLKSLSESELNNLIDNICVNLVPFNMSRIRLYTVHAYKGMEDDNLRLAEDIDISEDENIYYVGITRGKKKIMMD